MLERFLTHNLWEFKLVQPLRKTVWGFSEELKIELLYTAVRL